MFQNEIEEIHEKCRFHLTVIIARRTYALLTVYYLTLQQIKLEVS
jgi:hypothetical protein